MRFIFIYLIVVASLGARPLDLEVHASSAILMNAETGAILYEKQAHVPSFPASTTKIATALFILDVKKPSLDQMVTVSSEALKLKSVGKEKDSPSYWDEVDGTKMGLVRGEILSYETLLYGMMLVSGNDAANTMAESLSGSIPTFLEEMNQYLSKLGCKNTQFRNPHGLHHPEHFTTAYDICLIAKKAIQIPKFREIVSKSSYLKPKTNKQKETELRQFNQLLRPGKHYYAKAIGIKTGYHSNAKSTLVAAAESEGRTLIAVLYGCENKTDRYADAKKLFDAAYEESLETRRMFGSEQIFSRVVTGAKTSLQAALGADLTISFYPAEDPFCKAFIQWDQVPLPIKKGQKVGEVRICNEAGILLRKGDLLAKEEAKGSLLFVLKEAFKSLFN